MKHKLILFWILILLSFSCKKPGIVINNGFAIKNITIIDPIDGVSGNMTIIIKDNKIENIDNTKDIWFVIKNGNYLDRSELDSLLMN